MKTIPPYCKPMLDMMYEMVGDPEKDSVQLAATSPALNADKIMAPLFVAQGAELIFQKESERIYPEENLKACLSRLRRK